MAIVIPRGVSVETYLLEKGESATFIVGRHSYPVHMLHQSVMGALFPTVVRWFGYFRFDGELPDPVPAIGELADYGLITCKQESETVFSFVGAGTYRAQQHSKS